MELEGVPLHQGQNVRDGEHGFREIETGAERADFFDDGFVGEGSAAGDGLFVSAINEVLPGGADVGGIAVVGGLVDQDAKVEVVGLIGVLIIKLMTGC